MGNKIQFYICSILSLSLFFSFHAKANRVPNCKAIGLEIPEKLSTVIHDGVLYASGKHEFSKLNVNKRSSHFMSSEKPKAISLGKGTFVTSARDAHPNEFLKLVLWNKSSKKENVIEMKDSYGLSHSFSSGLIQATHYAVEKIMTKLAEVKFLEKYVKIQSGDHPGFNTPNFIRLGLLAAPITGLITYQKLKENILLLLKGKKAEAIKASSDHKLHPLTHNEFVSSQRWGGGTVLKLWKLDANKTKLKMMDEKFFASQRLSFSAASVNLRNGVSFVFDFDSLTGRTILNRFIPNNGKLDITKVGEFEQDGFIQGMQALDRQSFIVTYQTRDNFKVFQESATRSDVEFYNGNFERADIVKLLDKDQVPNYLRMGHYSSRKMGTSTTPIFIDSITSQANVNSIKNGMLITHKKGLNSELTIVGAKSFIAAMKERNPGFSHRELKDAFKKNENIFVQRSGYRLLVIVESPKSDNRYIFTVENTNKPSEQVINVESISRRSDRTGNTVSILAKGKRNFEVIYERGSEEF